MALSSRMGRIVALVVVMASLAACTATSRVVRTYDGEARDAAQVATLFKPGDIKIESVDGVAVKTYLLDSLEMVYEILPGERTVAFRYEAIWATPGRKENDQKQADVIQSELQQVTFNAVAGQTYSFEFPQPRSRAEAEQLAGNFKAVLVNQAGAELAVSQDYVEPPKELVSPAMVLPSQGAVQVSGEKVSNLDALKLLWERTSAEDKKEFLRWAFE